MGNSSQRTSISDNFSGKWAARAGAQKVANIRSWRRGRRRSKFSSAVPGHLRRARGPGNGMSQRKICRTAGVDRKTIRKIRRKSGTASAAEPNSPALATGSPPRVSRFLFFASCDCRAILKSRKHRLETNDAPGKGMVAGRSTSALPSFPGGGDNPGSRAPPRANRPSHPRPARTSWFTQSGQ